MEIHVDFDVHTPHTQIVALKVLASKQITPCSVRRIVGQGLLVLTMPVEDLQRCKRPHSSS